MLSRKSVKEDPDNKTTKCPPAMQTAVNLNSVIDFKKCQISKAPFAMDIESSDFGKSSTSNTYDDDETETGPLETAREPLEAAPQTHKSPLPRRGRLRCLTRARSKSRGRKTPSLDAEKKKSLKDKKKSKSEGKIHLKSLEKKEKTKSEGKIRIMVRVLGGEKKAKTGASPKVEKRKLLIGAASTSVKLGDEELNVPVKLQVHQIPEKVKQSPKVVNDCLANDYEYEPISPVKRKQQLPEKVKQSPKGLNDCLDDFDAIIQDYDYEPTSPVKLKVQEEPEKVKQSPKGLDDCFEDFDAILQDDYNDVDTTRIHRRAARRNSLTGW